ncbi:alpha-1,2-fucosyltransferase, partial [Candidatus Sumerlaeota bacterium]|nr:alpha-1,2-fucosyltransferase [Candidatus Sumerlaeota bacterium]
AEPHNDLRLMTQCRHHILCPSTFGWWGAWLGKRPGQIVVATRKFYLQDIPSTEYYYPPGWIQI